MIITKTPFRVSFFGGGTDYPEYFRENNGAVLGTAIDKYAYHSITKFHSKLFDYNLRIAYSQVETVNNVDDILHTPFKECMKELNISKDIEINYSAELPSFSGLGSSSTFVVGLLKGLYEYTGKEITPLQLAYKAIDMERNVLMDTVGCQDQSFAALGGFNVIEFKECNDMTVSRVPLSLSRKEEFENSLMMVYTNMPRRSANYAKQQIDNVHQNNLRLKRMRLMVDEGYDVLTSNRPIEEFGELLHEAWMAKKSLTAGMSNGAIDELYELGLQNGATGGKLLGAGGGGFLLFFVDPDKKKNLRQAMSNFDVIDVKVDAPGSSIIHK